MKVRNLFIVTLCLFLTTGFSPAVDDRFENYTIDPNRQSICMYWKDDSGNILKSIGALKTWMEDKKKKLLFAMNGGMYMTNNAPLGLYIENKKTITKLNTRTGEGNFYLQPNGVFYITTDNKAVVSTTANFKNTGNIKYATQSGPMLVVDGKIHPAFKQGSKNVFVRNGVGITKNGSVVFAISKEAVNLYDFANYFKQLGCANALFLDGFVSRMYLPEKNWLQTDGNFGAIIAITE